MFSLQKLKHFGKKFLRACERSPEKFAVSLKLQVLTIFKKNCYIEVEVVNTTRMKLFFHFQMMGTKRKLSFSFIPNPFTGWRAQVAVLLLVIGTHHPSFQCIPFPPLLLGSEDFCFPAPSLCTTPSLPLPTCGGILFVVSLEQ